MEIRGDGHGIVTFILAVMVIADAVTTVLALRAGAAETNPRLRWLMDRMGIVLALTLTHGGIVVVLWLLGSGMPPIAALPLASLFGVAAVRNIQVLRRLDKR